MRVVRPAVAILIAVAFGAVGAITAWVALGQLLIEPATIALGLTVVGWMASAYFAEQAQRRMFRHNVVNTARGEIVKAIRETQGWLSRLETYVLVVRDGFVNRGFIQGASVGEVRQILHDSPAAEMIMRLEEYELLFPATRHVREQLQHALIELRLTDFEPNLGLLATGEASRIDKGTKALSESRAADVSACLEDLLIWIQNYSLSQFTGQKVPERKPLDPSLPRVIVSAERLEIFEEGTPWAVRMPPPDLPPRPPRT